jgi:THO complex subunit 2
VLLDEHRYTAFLTQHIASEDYAKRLPGINELCGAFRLQPQVAFSVWRPTWTTLVARQTSALTDDGMEAHVKARTQALEPLVKDCTSLVPASVWSLITPHFYATFWALSLYDLDTPSATYKTTVEKLRVDLG